MNKLNGYISGMNRYNSGMSFPKLFITLLVFLQLVVYSSCTQYQPPELKKIEDLKLKMRGGDQIELFGKLIFYNPNKAKFKLKSYHLDVYLEDKKITELKDNTKMVIYPEQDFSMNAVANFSLKELEGDIFSSALGLLSSRLQLRFEGNIKIARNGININIPVSHREKVKF